MGDKWNSDRDRDEQVVNRDSDERVRGVANDDADYDDSEDLDEEDETEEDEGSTF